MSTPSVEARDVAISSIKPRKGFNLREEIDLEGKEIEDLGASIKADGLLVPLIVEETEAGQYEIVSGHRRYAAIRKVGLRGTVPVRVVQLAAREDAILMNIAENTIRKDVHSADLARRLYELEQGTYPGVAIDVDGNGALPIERGVICLRTGLSNGYVGNLIRAWSKLVDKIRREWRKRDIPTDVVIKWGKLKTEEEQVAALEAWKEEIAAAEARKAAGLKREKASSKGDADGGEEPSEEAGPKKRKIIAEHLEKFTARRESEVLSARDLEIADAKISTLRWVLGETKRLTFT